MAVRRITKPRKKAKTRAKAKTKPKTTPPVKKVVPPVGTQPQPEAGAPGTTTTTSSGGLPPGTADQLAQDAGQIEDQASGADAYSQAQPMVTSPSTQAPANAGQDAAQDATDQAMQSFFSTGSGDAVHYHQGVTYAQTIAASSGAENNPT